VRILATGIGRLYMVCISGAWVLLARAPLGWMTAYETKKVED
jgi:hypothetical protein